VADTDVLVAFEAGVVIVVVGAASGVPCVKVRTSTVCIGMDIVLSAPPILWFMAVSLFKIVETKSKVSEQEWNYPWK